MPPTGGKWASVPIYGAFSLAENAADSALYFAEFQQNAEAEFLCPYMGLFWSVATPFFSKCVVPLARLLKNDFPSRSLLNFSNLLNFSKNGNASSSRFCAALRVRPVGPFFKAGPIFDPWYDPDIGSMSGSCPQVIEGPLPCFRGQRSRVMGEGRVRPLARVTGAGRLARAHVGAIPAEHCLFPQLDKRPVAGRMARASFRPEYAVGTVSFRTKRQPVSSAGTASCASLVSFAARFSPFISV